MHTPERAPLAKRRLVDRTLDFPFSQAKAYTNEAGERIVEGIATTPAVDRAGDTIDPMGVEFDLVKRPIKMLWQHDPERPVGRVLSATATPQGVSFVAKLAAPGANPAIDQRWQDITAGLVDSLSIGFRATKPPKQTRTGFHYPGTEWLELSFVTIPANPECRITTIKAFDPNASNHDGESAAPVARIGNTAMTLKEQIAARKARIAELREQVSEMVTAGLTAETVKDFEALNADLEAEIADRDLLVRALRNSADEAVEVIARTGTHATVPVPVQRTAPAAPAYVSRAARQMDKERPKAQILFRACAVHVLAYANHAANESVAEMLFPGDELLKGYLTHQKAAVEPALTSVPEWAGNLARETWGEFLDLLLPESVYAQIAQLGARFTFGRAGKIMLPARQPTPTLAGDFIGENKPIPVRKAAILTAQLTPKKLAVISAFSREMSTVTGGQIEDYIRQFMVEDTAQVIDAKLLDNVAADAIRPAGLLNGVTLTPSAGSTLADILTDVKAAMTPILTANGGRRLVWLMNPLQAMSLGLQTNAAGAFIFPGANREFLGYRVIVSNNVPAGTLILIDVADFATAANDTPMFDVSNEATLHMESATPEPINDGTPASPVISLFQQDSFAVRMIQQMNWTMRRTGMVSGVSGITW
jgi:HK97 family phage prohead protease/HK97 family phage major capsid protein